jgi:recombination protein RecA
MDVNDKEKKRLAALNQVEKAFGKGALITASDFEDAVYDVIPSGSLGIDRLSGIGGYAKGRIIEIYGPNASGKTTLTLHAIANCQARGGHCAFIDAEHTFPKEYAQAIGVDLTKLDLTKPNSGEQSLEIVDMLTRSGAYDLIVIDSVSALVPMKELADDMGKMQPGSQARLMGNALRKLVSNVGRGDGTTIIFLNQIRMKIGVMFGSPETTSGGNALGFFSTLRVDVRRTGSIKKGEDVIGGRTRVKIVKNKLAGTAYHTCEFDMYSNNEYGAGICYAGEVFDAAIQLGIIDKAGAWYSYEGERLGQGRDNVVKVFKEGPFFDVINKAVRKEYGLDDKTEA